MPQTTWEFREISHSPILSALHVEDPPESWCSYRIEIILLDNLYKIDNNLNCKIRVLRKFFVNL